MKYENRHEVKKILNKIEGLEYTLQQLNSGYELHLLYRTDSAHKVTLGRFFDSSLVTAARQYKAAVLLHYRKKIRELKAELEQL